MSSELRLDLGTSRLVEAAPTEHRERDGHDPLLVTTITSGSGTAALPVFADYSSDEDEYGSGGLLLATASPLAREPGAEEMLGDLESDAGRIDRIVRDDILPLLGDDRKWNTVMEYCNGIRPSDHGECCSVAR